MNRSEELIIKEYEEKDKDVWDCFVTNSKNGTFLHYIDYLHYHLDRFNDCSLIIKNDKNKIVAVMPGNIENGIFYSHKGLTYGGLIILPQTKVEDVIQYFSIINDYLKENKQINKVVYRAIPYIYSSIPAQEDQYVLFRLNAKLISCGIASVLHINQRLQDVFL